MIKSDPSRDWSFGPDRNGGECDFMVNGERVATLLKGDSIKLEKILEGGSREVCRLFEECLRLQDRVQRVQEEWEEALAEIFHRDCEKARVEEREIWRKRYEECFVCKAALLPSEVPPHCPDCQVTDDLLIDWEEACATSTAHKASGGPAIVFTTRRTKSLAELTALDIPRGLDPEDVALDYEPEHQRSKR